MSSLQPGQSSVVTYLPDGVSQPRYLGAVGHVASLVYSYSLPGGPDQMSCTLQVEAMFRTDAMNPGRIVKIYRGGSCIWEGILLEPTPGSDGWQITASGAGNYGSNYVAVYSTWTNQNDAVNQAIARGLRWANPGIPSGVWLGQQQDSGSTTITDLLNLFCTMGGYTWSVGRGNVLSVYPWATAPVTRLLTCAAPVARSLGGFENSLWMRYEASADGSSGAAVYDLDHAATIPASITQVGTFEAYADLSDAGVMGSSSVAAAGANVLAKYQSIAYAGPFVVHYGEYLMPGGQPVDIGQEQAGQVVKLLMTDYGYGGEVVPDPVSFVVGNIEYDDEAQTASITPYQSLNTSLSGLLGTLGQPGGTALFEQAHPWIANPTS